MAQCGIYIIQSIIKPHKIYVGSSKDIANRWRLHIVKLKNNTHHSPKLRCHVNKYGIDDLRFQVIEICEQYQLFPREQFYLDYIKPFFNTNPIAEGRRDSKLSEETRRKIAMIRKGKKLSEETKSKISLSNKGKKQSEEARRKMSISKIGNKNAKGAVRTPEYCRKITEANLRNGNVPPSRKGFRKINGVFIKVT